MKWISSWRVYDGIIQILIIYEYEAGNIYSQGPIARAGVGEWNGTMHLSPNEYYLTFPRIKDIQYLFYITSTFKDF